MIVRQPPALQVDYLLRWEIMEQFLPRLMDPHGLQGHLGLQINFLESPMQIAPLWQWVDQEPSSLLWMLQLGLLRLLEHQINLEESPTEIVYS